MIPSQNSRSVTKIFLLCLDVPQTSILVPLISWMSWWTVFDRCLFFFLICNNFITFVHVLFYLILECITLVFYHFCLYIFLILLSICSYVQICSVCPAAAYVKLFVTNHIDKLCLLTGLVIPLIFSVIVYIIGFMAWSLVWFCIYPMLYIPLSLTAFFFIKRIFFQYNILTSLINKKNKQIREEEGRKLHIL